MTMENENGNLQFTCITCRVKFFNLEVQKQHYKSDWHRYNLKRKVAELPSISVEDFNKRVTEHQKPTNSEINLFQCKTCKKHFSSQKQYENHLNSKKHKDQVTKINIKDDEDESMAQVPRKHMNDFSKKTEEIEEIETDSEVESVDSDEWIKDSDNPVKRNNCIFCTHHSKSLVRNLKHMTEAHSFFVADLEYCIDVKGLVEYLGEKVYIGYMCIWCCDKGKSFQSAEAVQAHMIDKGHCKMLHESENLFEYEDFYDYSSSYPDAENGDSDEEVESLELNDDGYQLQLPSGAVIGHRSLMKYYKQNLHSNKVMSASKNQKLRKIIYMYKALGWKGNDKQSIAKKVRDIKYMHKMQTKYLTKLQFKQNKLQTHFRQQVNF